MQPTRVIPVEIKETEETGNKRKRTCFISLSDLSVHPPDYPPERDLAEAERRRLRVSVLKKLQFARTFRTRKNCYLDTTVNTLSLGDRSDNDSSSDSDNDNDNNGSVDEEGSEDDGAEEDQSGQKGVTIVNLWAEGAPSPICKFIRIS